MYATIATEPGSDAPNEDWAGFLPDAVVVLDGVTVRPGIESGCRHGTPWYVHELGIRLLQNTTFAAMPLDQALAYAIAEVSAAHEGWCDLATIGAPSAAAAIVRAIGDRLEWLALADVTVVLDTVDGIKVISDHRVEASTAGLTIATPALGERIRDARETYRNTPGGYWVAAADPRAADHALTGSMPLTDVRRVMVATDGAARLVDLFSGWSALPWGDWEDVMKHGPDKLIREVRRLEAKDPDCTRWPRTKAADDATAVLWVPDSAGAASGGHTV